MEDNKKNKEEIHPDLQVITSILNFITSKYVPAESFKDADVMLTTHEIYQQIISHYPNPVLEEKHIYNALIFHLFKYDSLDGDLRFVWLLKNKTFLTA